jgi:hypothetical protein
MVLMVVSTIIKADEYACPCCSGILKYYDSVRRIIRGKYGTRKYLVLRRFKCLSCGKIHREITDDVFPFKQYDSDIIQGILENLITTDMLGYEDYPCGK